MATLPNSQKSAFLGANCRTREFCPPHEALAFVIREKNERDLPEIWAEPLPIVTSALERYSDVSELYADLPDVQLMD